MSFTLERIEELSSEVRDGAADGEKEMRLADSNAKALRDCGVIRMLQPRDFGGQEASPREFAEATMALGALDGATGWVSGIVGVHPWELAVMDRRLQAEIWAEDPDTWVASPYAPMGTARPVADGYIVSGQWTFSTGNDHSDWVVTGATLIDAEGVPTSPPRTLHVVIPKSDYVVDHASWNVVGLRGTGSKTFKVDGAFVPDYRTIDSEFVTSGDAWRESGREGSLYKFPFWTIFPLGITSSLIGMAEGALATYFQAQRERVTAAGTKIKEDPYVLFALGEAAADIAASRAAILETVDRFWDTIERGETVTFEERAAGRRTQVAAAWRAVRATDAVFANAGGGSLQLSSPLQRFWRDAHAGLAHAIHVPGRTYHASSLTRMGVEPEGLLRGLI
ncbi:acyl-CoA dehydrogenase family protein [Gordonia sp. NPDC127522]|uniref:acyl-CoA dehydrogenase family protein n=1 Tax=Gordonia sp. NPDC127522 TaxID=3345390 RepID=UPI0036376D1D